jgi:hypothetical protein
MLLTGVVRAALFSRGADREEGSSVAASFVATLLLPFVKQHVREPSSCVVCEKTTTRGDHEVVGGNVLRQQVEACVAVAKTAPLPPRGLGATRGVHENRRVSNKKSRGLRRRGVATTAPLSSQGTVGWRGTNLVAARPLSTETDQKRCRKKILREVMLLNG